jgi:hypothetical protein
MKGPCQRVLAGTLHPSAISGAENKGSQGTTGATLKNGCRLLALLGNRRLVALMVERN